MATATDSNSSEAATPAMASPATTKPPNPNANLHSLPEELVSNIAIKLGSDDLFALRLTCKAIEAKSLHDFGTEYFTAKCFMVMTESLKVLLNIARSEKLRQYLQHVFIITATVSDRQHTCCHGNSCPWKPTVRHHEAFLRYKTDQDGLRENGGDLQFLVQAFSNLPQLHHLSLVVNPNALPATAECHGLRKFSRTTNVKPAFEPHDGHTGGLYYSWLTHVWQTMMKAVAESGISTITKLDTRINKDYLLGLSPITELHFEKPVRASLAKAFANLTKLDLTFRTACLRPGKSDTSKDLTRAANMIHKFSSVLKNVTNLNLRMDSGEWAGSFLKFFHKSMNFGQLTQLSLDTNYVDTEPFAEMICSLKSATMIEIQYIELTDGGSWVPILDALRQLPALEHLHIFFVQAAGKKVYFLEQPESGDPMDEPFIDPLTAASLGLGGNESEWDDEDDSDDESLPALLPEGEEDDDDLPALVAQDESPASSAVDAADIPLPSFQEPPRKKCRHYIDKNHRHSKANKRERGYYVCLGSKEEIEEQIPTFMKEYNVSDTTNDDIQNMLAGAMGGGFGGAFAMPMPMPAQPPPGAGGGAAPGHGAAPGMVFYNGPPPHGHQGHNGGVAAIQQLLQGAGFQVGVGPPPAQANQGQGQGQAGNAGGQAAGGAAPTAAATAPAAGAAAANATPAANPPTQPGPANWAGAGVGDGGENDGWMVDDSDADHGALDDVD